jgi:D-alanyl-D-alanine dipeptidase
VKLALFLALALAACGRSEQAVVEPPPTQVEQPRTARLLDQAPEAIVGIVDSWSSTKATLTRWRRTSGAWTKIGESWPAVVGRSGTAWGYGLHGNGAPGNVDGPVKREGDGKTPAGVFALGASFGYATAAPTGSRLPYSSIDESWKCVDDPASKHYNRVLDQKSAPVVDWTSAEDMKRGDELYEWVVDVAHNTERIPRHGSCIFLHVWGGPESATVGCTAMAKPVLAELIATLDPKAVFVLLPKAAYRTAAIGWGLPPI